MQIYLDTANINEIREAASWGILSGVPTNPSLLARGSDRLGDRPKPGQDAGLVR